MKKILQAALYLLPPVVVVLLAAPRFLDGILLNAAFPAPDGIAANRALSPSLYHRTAVLLSLANMSDGQVQITRGAAADFDIFPGPQALAIVTQGLQRSPASIQGWMLLTEKLEASDPARAAETLAAVLEMSQFDYWQVSRKAEAGAVLWTRLPADTQQQVVDQARLLWSTPGLRPQILPLLRVPGGAALMTQAVHDPDQIRALNRYVRQQKQGAL